MIEDERGLIEQALDHTMVVEAAAGTGKTTALVRRIVRLLETERARIGEIVAVTFSEKAAGELKLRLREEIERARAAHPPESPAAALLTAAVYDFEEAHLSTIHGFCAELLRERPVEALVDPAFVVLTESQADRLFEEAFTTWLQDQLAAPDEGVRRSLRRLSRWRDGGDEMPIARLHAAARELREWRDHEAPWRRPPFDRLAAIDAVLAEVQRFAETTAVPLKRGDIFHGDTEPARRLWSDVARMRSVGGDDYDGWEAALVALADDRDFARARKGSGAAFAEGVTRAEAHAAHAALRQRLADFAATANADLAACLHEETRGCLSLYAARKQAAGALDFLDLLIKARDLVRDQPLVRRAFQQRFRYLLVDEFQDTDPLQTELLLTLAGDEAQVRTGSLFVVGDPKQSIYRFRRADIGAYRRVSGALESVGAMHVRLQTSFRAVPALQRLVNHAFAAEMDGDVVALQADYVALRPARPPHEAQPSVVVIPVPSPYGKWDITQTALEGSQPAALAAYIQWLLSDECQWTVDAPHPDDPSQRARRRIVPSDICLLFRRFLSWGADVTRAYVDELEARGVPHLLVGGKSFFEREEVDALRTALTAIEWPEDELSVFATLKGPLFALGDEALLQYHAHTRHFHPYRVPADLVGDSVAVGAALGTLRELHATRNVRPVADTIGRLLAATRAHAGFVLWRGGEQVLANVLHVSDLARRYESEGGLSFRGFVDLLREAASRTEAPEAPILEEGSDGVRLMTVHKAKGLEFPVVVLADMGCKMNRGEAGRYIDPERRLCAVRIGGWAPVELLEHQEEEVRRDAAEGVRLAYVAATRARDLLVVPAVGDRPYDAGWLAPLNRAIYPPLAQRHDPQEHPACPPMAGRDTVLERPDGQLPDASTVWSGAYELGEAATGEAYTVVWWDPARLAAQAADARGIRRDDLIARDASPEDIAADRARLDNWRTWREHALARGGRSSSRLVSVSAHVAAVHGDDPERPADAIGWAGAADVQLLDAAAFETLRPSGRRFGMLVHAVLAAVPLDADAAMVGAVARVQAQLLAATDEEQAFAARAVAGVLGHPLLVRARAAQAAGRACWREVALSLVVPAAADGGDAVIDGQADLAWDDGDRWVVVDFKTDYQLTPKLDLYRTQVAIYLDAVRRTTGKPAEGVLLRV